MRLCVLTAWLFLASPLLAASAGNSVRAVGGSSPLDFQIADEAQQDSNEDNQFCYTTTGVSYFSNWSTSLALPPPFDFPPSLVAHGLNLLLRFCPPGDQLGSSRPYDGDMSGTADCDAGVLELLPDWIFGDGFEF